MLRTWPVAMARLHAGRVPEYGQLLARAGDAYASLGLVEAELRHAWADGGVAHAAGRP